MGIDGAEHDIWVGAVVGDHLPRPRFQKIKVGEFGAVYGPDVVFGIGADRLVECFVGGDARDAELAPDAEKGTCRRRRATICSSRCAAVSFAAGVRVSPPPLFVNWSIVNWKPAFLLTGPMVC
jgi:hypothetical protein